MDKWYFLVVAILIFSNGTKAQVYFQIERANSLDVKRYSINDMLTYRTNQFGENWITDPIGDILPEANSLLFYDRITHLDEITHIRYNRTFVQGLGTNTMRFGIAWLSFGVVIEGLRRMDAIETQYEFGADTAIIGGTAILTGYLSKKIWGTVVRKINNKNRLRIIDVRF